MGGDYFVGFWIQMRIYIVTIDTILNLDTKNAAVLVALNQKKCKGLRKEQWFIAGYFLIMVAIIVFVLNIIFRLVILAWQ